MKTTITAMALLAAFAGTAISTAARAEVNAREVMEKVNARDDGERVTRNIRIEKTDRRGNVRVETSKSYRKDFGADKKSMFFYTSPAKLRGTSFLTFDYKPLAKNDDQWLYLPAMRKVRRISSSDRGAYFLGTDFTFEEIKNEQKVELADYTFKYVGDETVAGHNTHMIEMTAVDEDVAEELGYSRVVSRVDPTIWMSRKTDFYDLNGNHLKTFNISQIEMINGIVTATEFSAKNHKTGHSTRFTFSDIDYAKPVQDSLFTKARLRRGL